MRQIWLTLLTAFALAASGVAGAVAMPDCPMQAAAPVAADAMAHECCPDSPPANNGGAPHDQGMDGCLLGMACRTATAVAPTLAPLKWSAVWLVLTEPVFGDPAPPSGPLQQLFRPPRTI